jgi:MFS family permease
VRIPADAPSSVAPRVEPLPPLLWGIGLALLVLAVTRGPESGWASAGVLSLALTGLALLAAFLTLQRRSADPLLPLELVAGPLGAAVTLTFLGQLLSVSVGFLMPFVLETSGGLHAAQTGRWLTVLPGAALLCAPIAGRLADRLSPRTLTVAGMALTAAGLWMLAGLGQAISYPWLATALSLVGVGLGLFTIPNSSALLSLVPRERLGVASGLQGTARTLGLTGGVALGGAMITAYYHHHTGGALHLGLGQVDGAAFALATRETFRGMAVLAVLGIWLSWRVRSPRRATP